MARALPQRSAHATRSPARFAVSMCSAQNLVPVLPLLIEISIKFFRASSPVL